ncbi:uncharacterized protein LOC127284902 [Leptopilina boulardi]|uniref:uncharacterized protein LOC127284902 n=1 Tax=Leptopilina boulardi TaxID=63433 RepID=UPI0021F55373|nr:uncharacterized protein LOC127284902 [Leptopilina boulardi]XP_051166577.1 uncharacterized protein LOC127284902 [Leptopilina boulardi]
MEASGSSRSAEKRREKSQRDSRDKSKNRSFSRDEVRSRRGRHFHETERSKKSKSDRRIRSRSPRDRSRKNYSDSRRSFSLSSSDSDYAPDVRERSPRGTSEHGRFADRSPRDSTDADYSSDSPSDNISKKDKSNSDSDSSNEDFDSPGDVQLNNEVLTLLGDDPNENNDSKGNIHNVLRKNWSTILTKGMTKESTEEILKKYTPPKNFVTLKPPALNSEIKRTMTEKARKKDTFQVKAQEKIGAAIHATGLALSNILNQGNSMDTSVVSYLSDAARILSDAHYNISITRRAFITPNVNRLVEDVTVDEPVGSLLFGDKLSERLKSAREVEKHSKSIIKSTSSGKNNYNRFTYDKSSYRFQRPSYKNVDQTFRNLNFRGPSGGTKRTFKSRQDGQNRNQYKNQRSRGRR